MSKRKEATPSWGRSWDGNSCLMGGIQIKVHQSEVVCFHTWGKELCIDPEQVSWARKQKILFSNLTFIPVKNTEYCLCTRQWQTMPSNGNRRRDSELTNHTHTESSYHLNIPVTRCSSCPHLLDFHAARARASRAGVDTCSLVHSLSTPPGARHFKITNSCKTSLSFRGHVCQQCQQTCASSQPVPASILQLHHHQTARFHLVFRELEALFTFLKITFAEYTRQLVYDTVPGNPQQRLSKQIPRSGSRQCLHFACWLKSFLGSWITGKHLSFAANRKKP